MLQTPPQTLAPNSAPTSCSKLRLKLCLKLCPKLHLKLRFKIRPKLIPKLHLKLRPKLHLKLHLKLLPQTPPADDDTSLNRYRSPSESEEDGDDCELPSAPTEKCSASLQVFTTWPAKAIATA